MDFGSNLAGGPISSLLPGVSSLSLAWRQCEQLQQPRLLPSPPAGPSPSTLAQPRIHGRPERSEVARARRPRPERTPGKCLWGEALTCKDAMAELGQSRGEHSATSSPLLSVPWSRSSGRGSRARGGGLATRMEEH